MRAALSRPSSAGKLADSCANVKVVVLFFFFRCSSAAASVGRFPFMSLNLLACLSGEVMQVPEMTDQPRSVGNKQQKKK